MEKVGEKKIVSPCDVDALKRCLEENKGDRSKCQAEVEAFNKSCALKTPKPLNSTPESTTRSPSRKPAAMKIGRGVICDV
ncbi:hypothetical protein AQUCO_01300303v1 [Aquilegia coerulea]|uniref:Uncharacterized protein n=1 Tax=Aquilegia coerulea TaxID=218851 RepID=A0A2G5E0U5_AQUCA|nr:hypothetical protein AQUCO_01300303v1 [Aquilegia coerulea]PIA49392.1 hypothetical protein AQUCO_01300303v1 [Aquilegia coerulea]